MDAAVRSDQLRPLGLGEIFDRAVTLYVRNFMLFTLIALVVAVPFGGLEYLLDKSSAQSYQQIIQVIQHPETAKNKQKQQDLSPGESLAVLGTLAFFVLVAPFAAVASALGVWSLYGGRELDWRACYAGALARWPHVIGTTLCGACIGMVVFFAGLIAVTVPVVVGALTFVSSPAAGITAFVIALILFIAWLLTILLITLSIAFALCAVGVEQLGVGTALGKGFGRVFNRHEIGKAVLLALSIGAINTGLSFLTFTVEMLLVWLVHSHLVDAVMETAIAVVQMTFISILVAVYYVDARVRQEGLDMYAALDRLQTQTAP